METKRVCGKDHRYNGWTNYETWVVALWIDNEQGANEHRRELARMCMAGEELRAYCTKEETEVADYSDLLKEWIEADMVPELPASLASDLLRAALSEVNWREIAEHWIEEERDAMKEAAK